MYRNAFIRCRTRKGEGKAARAQLAKGNVHFPPRVGEGLGLRGMGRTDRPVSFLSVSCPCLPTPTPNQEGQVTECDGATRARRAKTQKKGMRALIISSINSLCSSCLPMPTTGAFALSHKSTKYLLDPPLVRSRASAYLSHAPTFARTYAPFIRKYPGRPPRCPDRSHHRFLPVQTFIDPNELARVRVNL